MRIIAGQYGGRKISIPKGRDIRPTSDKVRGAIFNALSSRISITDANVLDVFCGSGALGLEALSRGAVYCTFVDISDKSLSATKDNAQNFDIRNEAFFIKSDMQSLPARNKALPRADIIFCDPPYNKNLVMPSLQTLSEGDWINEGAIIVVETEKSFAFNFELECMFDVISQKTYGNTLVSFLQKPEV